MRVAVVGAFGYLGTALSRALCARGHVVDAFGRSRRCQRYLHERWRPGGAHVAAPCNATEISPYDMVGRDAVVCLTGGGASAGDLPSASAALRDNALSAAHVAAVATEAGVPRLLLASSIYVYGATSRPCREVDPCAPDTLYGALKVVAEAVWRERGGACLRLSHVYGVGDGVEVRDGVTERLARCAAGHQPFAVHGDGSQTVDFVHVDDACEAFVRALEAPAIPSVINVGGTVASIGDLVRAFQVAAPGLRVARGAGVVHLERRLDASLAASAIGWFPRASLDDAVAALVARFAEVVSL